MSFNLTKDQIEELQEAFRMYDLNDNGRISPHEMRLALISVGHENTESELYDLIGTVTVHRNADLSLPQFMQMMAPRMESVESEENLTKTFRLFDRDDDGYMTSQDVRAFMVMMGVGVSDTDIRDICREVDMDHDGRISLRDFLNFMHSPL
ncbi:calmodulin-2 [Drosophila serrata]|uniref:calmodulin-2 n=1 Tax=Drosophila serrata TaxID=7274 RepID=UPI000A1CF5E8|nr:calmodulin-2 [Drosophila serrata]